MPAHHGGLVELLEAAEASCQRAVEAHTRNTARMHRLNRRSLFEAAIVDDHVATAGELKKTLDRLVHIREEMSLANGARRLHLVSAAEVQRQEEEG